MRQSHSRPASPPADFQQRSSGLLLHVTSLPGVHGSGDLSASAYRFVDFLAEAGQTWWQMLPVGPPGDPPGNSPYSSCSSIAGSPQLVSLETLEQEGWLAKSEVRPSVPFDATRIDFPGVRSFREQRLRLAWSRWRDAHRSRGRAEFEAFGAAQAGWLDDFALFRALKEQFRRLPWVQWPEDLRRRDPSALVRARNDLRAECDYHRWVQFQFDRQWTALRRYAHRHGVGLIGDLPILVSHDSADVWAQPGLFQLDARGKPLRVSGYPPDRFCRRGQRWGHPLYQWPAHQRTGFAWWQARFAGAYRLFDALRIDHFLGFTRLWSIPAGSRFGDRGRWVATPGSALFTSVHRTIGPRPMIAEDLGRVTAADVALREKLGIPAMRILQWGLGPGDPMHRPHRYEPACAAYTGTHDTNTLGGWLRSLGPRDWQAVLDYAGSDGHGLNLDLIRLLLNSAANLVITPVQDLLGLDGSARMNRPGTKTGNWGWRLPAKALTGGLSRQLRRMTELSDRTRRP